MEKLKIAILEDNKEQLKDSKQITEATGFADVVAWATSSEEFLEKVMQTRPDALLLDIDLNGDSMSGMDIAYKLKLPVMFVSGHNAKYLKEIESLRRDFDFTVDHITKPFTENDFKKAFSLFVKDINTTIKLNFAFLDFSNSRRNKVCIDTIVCLCADKAVGSTSNNKQIFFTDRNPEILIDFSFSNMEEKSLTKTQFITIHKSFRVNAEHIRRYNKDTHEIEVEVYKSHGKMETKKLPVSENYRNEVTLLKK